jgi:CRISPR-associated protein Cmr2
MTQTADDRLANIRTNWEALTFAYLHDPPDKALSIQTHVSRAARYASVAVEHSVTGEQIGWDATLGDRLAAIAERLPMPTAGAGGERAVGVDGDGLDILHPLGGPIRRIAVPVLDEGQVAAEIERIVGGIASEQARFFALWRLLPERMAALHPAYADLPADTRVPDHTIWHHADTVAAIAAALRSNGSTVALLSFAISPVQTWIEAARSLRDLRNGSLILSWLTFRAMTPIIDRLGPCAFVFPSLRGNALVDQWLRSDRSLARVIPRPSRDRLLAPSLPNRFLAVVPWGPQDAPWGPDLAAACANAARDAWGMLSASVRDALGAKLDHRFPGWDARWERQTSNFWDIATSVVPVGQLEDDAIAKLLGGRTFKDAFANADKVRSLADAIRPAERPRYDQHQAGRWQASVELAARVLEAGRGVRHVPADAALDGPVPFKCSLLGTWEQVGPATITEAQAFWTHVRSEISIGGARVRDGEAFCAIALVKRLAMGACLADELGLEQEPGQPREGRFPDTATVAAQSWIRSSPGLSEEVRGWDRGVPWSGQWLHQSGSKARTSDEADRADADCPEDVWSHIRGAREDNGPAPAYYAVLMMDGDDMGGWLQGEKGRKVGDALHPKLRRYFEAAGGSRGLEASRPVGPALHAAISGALGAFASRVVPDIVRAHDGTLVYAGGDDVLALLPTQSVFACAHALERAFRGAEGSNGGAPEGWFRVDGVDLPMMGPSASVSAGIAILHHKEDLRAALSIARDAERTAKGFGRDAVSVTFARRSGERSSVALPWTELSAVETAVDAFAAGASDRWLYKTRELLPAFAGGGLPERAFEAEMLRQFDRSEDGSRDKLGGADTVRTALRSFRASYARRGRSGADEAFVLLWQGASFLARGRDR